MPIIPANVINGVFYLYRTVEDATAGRDPGGTGFIAAYAAFGHSFPTDYFYYGITNWHVACQEGCSVIRLNTTDGSTDVIALNPDQWHFIPGKYDIAVTPLMLDREKHEVSAISVNSFLPRPEYGGPYAMVGDDVFMIGLFIDHGGKAVNAPSVRFGKVSMLPNAKALIEQPTGYRGETFVLDMHSRSGFSGSPVYVYRTFGSDLDRFWGHEFDEIEIDTDFLRSNRQDTIRGRGRLRSRNFFYLLGIHWAQFPEEWELRERKRTTARVPEAHVTGDERYIRGMSGMTCAIPAWEILEVLDIDELKTAREQLAAVDQNGRKPQPETVSGGSRSENP